MSYKCFLRGCLSKRTFPRLPPFPVDLLSAWKGVLLLRVRVFPCLCLAVMWAKEQACPRRQEWAESSPLFSPQHVNSSHHPCFFQFFKIIFIKWLYPSLMMYPPCSTLFSWSRAERTVLIPPYFSTEAEMLEQAVPAPVVPQPFLVCPWWLMKSVCLCYPPIKWQ